MSLEEGVREVIAQTLSIKPQEVKIDESLYDSLGMDSTEIVDLRVALEKRFSVKFDSKEITKSSSPQDIINSIKSKAVAA